MTENTHAKTNSIPAGSFSKPAHWCQTPGCVAHASVMHDCPATTRPARLVPPSAFDPNGRLAVERGVVDYAKLRPDVRLSFDSTRVAARNGVYMRSVVRVGRDDDLDESTHVRDNRWTRYIVDADGRSIRRTGHGVGLVVEQYDHAQFVKLRAGEVHDNGG